MADCSTIEGKVRYVLERHKAERPDLALSDRGVTQKVWLTFYIHKIFNGRGPSITLDDALQLPSVQQIAAARRRIEPRPPRIPKAKPMPVHAPWHAVRPSP